MSCAPDGRKREWRIERPVHVLGHVARHLRLAVDRPRAPGTAFCHVQRPHPLLSPGVRDARVAVAGKDHHAESELKEPVVQCRLLVLGPAIRLRPAVARRKAGGCTVAALGSGADVQRGADGRLVEVRTLAAGGPT
eukprot:SAG31_NODE_27_length_32731_cov_1443.130393_30_plen_136_part_00